MALARIEQGPQRFRPVPLFDNLHLENSFEDNGVAGEQVVDFLALGDVFQRCLSAQSGPTAPQRSNRGKCAHFLRDLAATANLPFDCPLFVLRLLDLTRRWWSGTEGPDIEEGDAYPLAAAASICIELHSASFPDPAPFQLPDPRQPARSLTDLLTALAAILGRRQPRNVPPLHTAQAVHEVVAEEYRESVNCELATCTPADRVRLFETRFSLSVEHVRQRFPQGTGSLLSPLARVLSGVLASLALCFASDSVRDRPLSLESTPSRIGSSAWFLSCVVWVSFLLSEAR